MTDSSYRAAGTAASWLSRIVRQNPEGLLLLGAGLALLMRSSGATARQAAETAETAQNKTESAATDAIAQETGTVTQFAQRARDQVSDTIKSYTAGASSYADRARESLAQQSSQLKEQSQAALRQGSDLLRAQPLAIAALGIGAGVGLAALLPATEIEERVVGPARQTARDAGERVARATTAAGTEIAHEIAKHGLDESGVKEMVGAVATSFTGALADHDRAQDGQSTPGGNPSAEASRDGLNAPGTR